MTVGKYKNGKNKKKKKKIQIEQKQAFFYSRKYAEHAKKRRETIFAKAVELIKNSSKYQKATPYSTAAYISNLKFDKDIGEILDTVKKLFLEKEKIKQGGQIRRTLCNNYKQT